MGVYYLALAGGEGWRHVEIGVATLVGVPETPRGRGTLAVGARLG